MFIQGGREGKLQHPFLGGEWVSGFRPGTRVETKDGKTVHGCPVHTRHTV